MGAVDRDGLETTIDDLSSTGELDNSGVGTRYYTLPGNQIAADYLYQELESYGLEVWYEDFVTWDGILLVNVVAQAPGRDESEMYAVMSHFDSFNTTTPRQAPGADDNATGIAVNLETARVLAGYELQHPVRFVFVNAEEVGIIGAQEWARAANAKGLPVRGVLNVDSVGSSRQGQYIATNADGGLGLAARRRAHGDVNYGMSLWEGRSSIFRTRRSSRTTPWFVTRASTWL